MKRLVLIIMVSFGVFISSCGGTSKPVVSIPESKVDKPPAIEQVKEQDNEYRRALPVKTEIDVKRIAESKYSSSSPRLWGEKAPGVKTKIDTRSNIAALTFDACGGKNGDGYDKGLIDYLISENIPATLFINSRWIDENPGIFMELSKNPLFEIENHGTNHVPLSINGGKVYGIKGTDSVGGVVDEVMVNAEKIQRLTGRRPRYFRSGTAYYDEIAVKILEETGEKAIGFDIIGDAGATYSKDQIKRACMGTRQGSIIIFHMNHPDKDTAEGIKEAIPMLRNRGFKFVKLEDYDLDLL